MIYSSGTFRLWSLQRPTYVISFVLRRDREAVRVTVCTRRADGWVAHYHQHPLKESMVERILQRQETRDALDVARSELHEDTGSPGTGIQADVAGIEVRRYPHGLDGSPAQ